jgi:hypothetical protein
MVEVEELPSYFGDLPPRRPEGEAAPRRPPRPPPSPSPPPPLPAEPLFLLRTAGIRPTFVRALMLPFASSVAALERWREEAGGAALAVGPGRLLIPPPGPAAAPAFAAAAAPAYVVRMHVRRVPIHAGVSMRLELFPWIDPYGTKISLRPGGGARAGRGYFRAGHAVLDAVVAGLDRYAAAL